jgi:hypothetical protein
MSARPLSWRRLAFFAWVALLAANLLVLGVFTLPRQWRERSLAARAERLRAELGQARERNRLLRERDQTARQNDVDVKRFYNGLVGTRENTLLPVLAALDNEARTLRLVPGPQSFEAKPLKNSVLVRFGIQMPVSGSYPQLVAYLDRLERLPYFLTVDGVVLKQRALGEGTELALRLSLYFREAIPSGAPAATKGTPRAR